MPFRLQCYYTDSKISNIRCRSTFRLDPQLDIMYIPYGLRKVIVIRVILKLLIDINTVFKI